MIYGFKSFFRFKLFILARMFVRIRHLRALEFVGSLNLLLKVPEFWYSIVRTGWNLAKLDRILFAGIRRQHPDVIGFCFLLLVIFSYELNAKEYFSRKSFFWKNNSIKYILRQKTFYVEINKALIWVENWWIIIKKNLEESDFSPTA
jgi:hypothetical protein